MKLIHKYGTRSIEVRKAKRELYFRLSLVIAVLLFFAAMVIVAKFRPRLDEATAADIPKPENVGDPLTNPQLIRLRGEIETLMRSFETSIQQGKIDLSELEALEKTIELQRDVIRLRGSEIAPKVDLDRLDKLLTLYDEHMGQFLIAQSETLERKAETLMENRQYEEALEALTKARNLQNEVNELYPRASVRDSARLHRLENKVTAWQTRPIAEEADRLKAEAFTLIGEQRYAQARVIMQEALDKQKLLNESHRESRYATISRLRQMENAWKQVQIAEDVDAVASLMETSRLALGSGRPEDALARAEEAEILQLRIMNRFPESEAAQQAVISEIRALKDTAASLPAYNNLKELREEVRSILRNRRLGEFKNKISEWLRATRDFERSYPGSRFTGELNVDEVNFLHERRDEIPSILETLYSNLVIVPGEGRVYLYKTEIPQALYERITGENPSSNKAPRLPVESVTWIEARAFTAKLSWIMALPVSLPSRSVFKSALGSMEINELSNRAWSSDNTARETQPVGTTEPNDIGFNDLLGNVSEWVGSAVDAPQERVIAAGGSVRDSELRLATVPEEPRQPTERNRFVGFRIAVPIAGGQP